MNRKSRDLKNFVNPWQYPDNVPQLPKYSYDRPFNLPPPTSDLYGDIKDQRERKRTQGTKKR